MLAINSQTDNRPRVHRILISFLFLTFSAAGLFPAPLESGFTDAPSPSASPKDKAAAYGQARKRVLEAAGKYERTPYRYGGIDRNGLDCSGLVYVSFRDALGINVPRNTGGLYAWAEKITLEEAEPGDLLFFKTTGDGSISHVGIYTGNRRFIHSASEGPVTGVIRSGLDESYWSRTYAGAGRALPASNSAGSTVSNTGGIVGDNSAGKGGASDTKKSSGKEKSASKQQKDGSNILMGVAAAPTWNTYFPDGYIFRGAAGQFRLAAEVKPFGQAMIFGLELRPEWDRALGIFRLPLTLSWGLNDKIRIFAGPALSFGNASLNVSGVSRPYTGGTAWFGAAGITAVPFLLKIANGELSPYAELAWQSYFKDSAEKNFGADLAAAIRVSTGLRYTWRTK